MCFKCLYYHVTTHLLLGIENVIIPRRFTRWYMHMYKYSSYECAPHWRHTQYTDCIQGCGSETSICLYPSVYWECSHIEVELESWRTTLVSSVGIALRAHTVTNWRLQCGGGPALICAVCRVNPARSLSLSSSHLAQPTDNSASRTQ